jgi:hypothetical protein
MLSTGPAARRARRYPSSDQGVGLFAEIGLSADRTRERLGSRPASGQLIKIAGVRFARLGNSRFV